MKFIFWHPNCILFIFYSLYLLGLHIGDDMQVYCNTSDLFYIALYLPVVLVWDVQGVPKKNNNEQL